MRSGEATTSAGVAGPSWRRRVGQWAAEHPGDCGDHLQDRGALAAADVEHLVVDLAAVQRQRSAHVRVGDVGNVDVVTHRGAVHRRVVVP